MERKNSRRWTLLKQQHPARATLPHPPPTPIHPSIHYCPLTEPDINAQSFCYGKKTWQSKLINWWRKEWWERENKIYIRIPLLKHNCKTLNDNMVNIRQCRMLQLTDSTYKGGGGEEMGTALHKQDAPGMWLKWRSVRRCSVRRRSVRRYEHNILRIWLQ